MGKKAKQRNDRPKKRKFHGNMYFKKLKFDGDCDKENESSSVTESVIEDVVQDIDNESSHGDAEQISTNTSFMKLNSSVNVENSYSDSNTGYRLFDLQNLVNFMRVFPCPSCEEHCGFDLTENNCGLSCKVSFSCIKCKETFTLNSSNENINLRFQLSMYSIGCHYEQGKKLLGNMNMPPPVSVTRSNHFKSRIHNATAIVANTVQEEAASELRSSQLSEDVTVSCDGTWQRRGFVSKNGVSTVLSVNPKGPPKVIDTFTSSSYCDKCSKSKKKLSPEQFLIWKEKHAEECEQNHVGTAGAMEPQGILKIFQRSQEKYGLNYVGYLGDGDSKSYKTVADADPEIYTGKSITKYECCGHVQKRMGRRLMDKVSECKGKLYKENGKQYKGIGGAGRLTQSAIKRIQGHYGGAIRKNAGNIVAMKKAVWAIWKHRTGVHDDCGKWCIGQKDLDKANKNKLPKFVTDEIKPVFEILSSNALLEKCLHGGTQNANESFHNLIWKRCPKTVFVGKKRLEIAVHDATIVYNQGELGRREVFKLLGLDCGFYAEASFRASDKKRIMSSLSVQQNQNCMSKSSKTRVTNADDHIDDIYIPGGF
ncbi:uncharacterized protein LOC131946415 [Physella acuta]|uniref:uncharacterized protein LOC131946415 n=1 Tax=Physella acuta TaxID=109671 RepID=UPI0027DD7B4A|nr:uncharacterized protein LOC131946415 [Physella acuta]